MKFRNIMLVVLTSSILISHGFITGAENSDDPGKLAYKVMQSAESFKKKGDVYQAGKIFLEAAMMYKKAIADKPDNRGYKTNFKFCLGTRGYIQIKKGDIYLKEKNYGEAAKYFTTGE